MFRYTFLIFALFGLPLRANLGENVQQCVARYGEPITYSEASPTSPFGTIVFQASGYTLVVFLVGDKEVGARVSKTDKSAFTDTERQNIMSADQGGSQWTSTPSTDPTCLQWSRADQATVLYDQKNKMLIFTSQEMAKALQAPSAKP